MKIIFATGNEHKAGELREILAGHEIVTPANLGLDFAPEETGSTFFENAMLKARALYKMVRQPVLADDSGLCVDALDGRPGIYSSRYGSDGVHKLDSHAKNTLLLGELDGKKSRKARFVCSMVLLYDDMRFVSAQETLEGEIALKEAGGGGFGYDPIVWLPEFNCTVAELPEGEKNRLSHRGKAARVIAKLL
jgi:XTP/dITP diphosphohydrolase